MKTPINDGGPAFPRPASVDPSEGTLHDGDRVIAAQAGLSLRDYFAAKAMAALIIADEINVKGTTADFDTWESTSRKAYEMADAMLKARAGK